MAAHTVLAVLTLVTLATAWYFGTHLWQILAMAAAATLLHTGALAARKTPWPGYGLGALGMLILVTTPALSWSPIMLPSAACFPLTLWLLTTKESTRSSALALTVAAVGIVLTELVAWSRLPSGVEGWTRWVEGALFMLTVGTVWLTALLIRHRQESARRAENDRLAAAVAGERASIRRDLHDVIAHTVTVMVARIEAAAVTTTDPATGKELADIAETGRDAHQGLRAMLATVAPHADRRPSQVPISLDAIPDLVAAAASPLHVVTFEEVGTRRPLSLSAEVAAVRTVQEGITNALRHLDPPVEVTASLEWTQAEVVVEVRDDGGRARRESGSRGTGLMGIEERVRTAGGSLSIEDGDGGWVLRARLPTKEGA
ncbi:sensor histidine kinase [Nonomuraea sp. NPDC050790]|uniref:sensor histidine kinase n=1 Tax=Nonomuraea sp. NPDC050790 TaxID=3364371 RepID=UPI00379CAB80